MSVVAAGRAGQAIRRRCERAYGFPRGNYHGIYSVWRHIRSEQLVANISWLTGADDSGAPQPDASRSELVQFQQEDRGLELDDAPDLGCRREVRALTCLAAFGLKAGPHASVVS
jgi:hypothetical protein